MTEMYPVLISRGDWLIEMFLVRPRQRSRLTGTSLDQLDKLGRTTEMWIARLYRPGQMIQKIKMYLVRLTRGKQQTETYRVQTIRPHRPDRSRGRYLADRKGRIGMMSVNNTKKTKRARNEGGRRSKGDK